MNHLRRFQASAVTIRRSWNTRRLDRRQALMNPCLTVRAAAQEWSSEPLEKERTKGTSSGDARLSRSAGAWSPSRVLSKILRRPRTAAGTSPVLLLRDPAMSGRLPSRPSTLNQGCWTRPSVATNDVVGATNSPRLPSARSKRSTRSGDPCWSPRNPTRRAVGVLRIAARCFATSTSETVAAAECVAPRHASTRPTWSTSSPKIFAYFDISKTGKAVQGTRYKSLLHKLDNLQASHTYCNKNKGNTADVTRWRHATMPPLAVALAEDGSEFRVPQEPVRGH